MKHHPITGEPAAYHTCPICGRPITSTQRLEVRTVSHMARPYWVTWHRYSGDIRPDGKPRDPSQTPVYVEHDVAWYPWCGQADVNEVTVK